MDFKRDLKFLLEMLALLRPETAKPTRETEAKVPRTFQPSGTRGMDERRQRTSEVGGRSWR